MSPVARVGLAPLPDAFDMGRATEIIPVVWFVEPAALAGGFAGVAALELGAVALAPSAARVRIKDGLAVLTLALSDMTCHGPESPRVHDQRVMAWTEENGEEKNGGKKIEEDGRQELLSSFREEDGIA